MPRATRSQRNSETPVQATPAQRSRSRSRGRQTKTIDASGDSLTSPKIPQNVPSTQSRRRSKSPARTTKAASAPISALQATPNHAGVRQSARIRHRHEQEKNVDHNSSFVTSLLKKGLKTREPLLDLNEALPRKKSTGPYYGGIFGTFCLFFILPSVLLASVLYCNSPSILVRKIDLPKEFSAYYDLKTIQLVSFWILLQSFFSLMPIGRRAYGQLMGEHRLSYRCNGVFVFLVNMIVFGGIYYTKKFPITYLFDHWIELASTLIVFSFILSVVLYIKSLRIHFTHASVDSKSNWKFYTYFMGHELNPRFLGLDLKTFITLRVGMIGWLLLDAICLVKSLEVNNGPNWSIITLFGFHFLYVVDALFFEEGFLISSTVSRDGLGYLLTFGSIAWMPIFYSMPIRFLVEAKVAALPCSVLSGIFCLNMLGYFIYRGANSQKNNFRKDPSNPEFSNYETLITQSGKKLLVFGWWSRVRHPHYLGDLIMAISWALATGFHSGLPWLYPTFLFVFLLHRMYKDERDSAKKYAGTWSHYKKQVPYRLVPRVF